MTQVLKDNTVIFLAWRLRRAYESFIKRITAQWLCLLKQDT